MLSLFLSWAIILMANVSGLNFGDLIMYSKLASNSCSFCFNLSCVDYGYVPQHLVRPMFLNAKLYKGLTPSPSASSCQGTEQSSSSSFMISFYNDPSHLTPTTYIKSHSVVYFPPHGTSHFSNFVMTSLYIS